jgi:hypothetical protein
VFRYGGGGQVHDFDDLAYAQFAAGQQHEDAYALAVGQRFGDGQRVVQECVASSVHLEFRSCIQQLG